MKIREGFVSNSSSTSFMITNTSASSSRTMVDFVRENEKLLGRFLQEYTWYQEQPRFNQEQMLKDAAVEDITFKPGESRECVFGDEDGTVIGHVYDYILRSGGTSESFTWEFKEYLR